MNADHGPDLKAILAFPWPLHDYLRWVASLAAERPAPTPAGPSGDEPTRFLAEAADVPVLAPEVDVQSGPAGLLTLAPARAVMLGGILAERAHAMLAAIDGRRTLTEVASRVGGEAAELNHFLRLTVGTLVLVPGAVAALEDQLPGWEIARLPTSPYAIERSYWRNMIAVRRALADLPAALAAVDRFAVFLRTLHVRALMGEDLCSFYRPASEVADHLIQPGAIRAAGAEGAVAVRLGNDEVEGYYRLLAHTVGDPYASGMVRDGAGGTEPGWGRIIRAEVGGERRLLFLPPATVSSAHLEELAALLGTAVGRAAAADRPGSAAALALFHQRFVRLHPFAGGNQSLAMNLVNYVLRRSHAGALPHLHLDLCALRFSAAGYQEVFVRALAEHLCPLGAGGDVYLKHRQKLARCLALAGKLGACSSPAEGLALASESPVEARLLLLRA